MAAGAGQHTDNGESEQCRGDAANLSLGHRWPLGKCARPRVLISDLPEKSSSGYSRHGVGAFLGVECARWNIIHYFPLAPVTCWTFHKHHPRDFSRALLRSIQAHKNSMVETQWTCDRNTLCWKEEVWHYQCSSSRAQHSSFFLWDAEHRRACRQRVRTRSHSNSPCFSDCFDIDRINK